MKKQTKTGWQFKIGKNWGNSGSQGVECDTDHCLQVSVRNTMSLEAVLESLSLKNASKQKEY